MIEDEDAHKTSSTLAPPPAPKSGPGPHFVFREGKVDLEPLPNNDADLERAEKLLPLLRQQVDDAKASIGRNSHPKIAERIDAYSDLIASNASRIDFDLLVALGQLLSNDEFAARRNVDRLAPSLEDEAIAALKNVLDLHGMIVSSLPAGLDLLDEAAKWRRTPEQDKDAKEAAIGLAMALQASDLATEQAKSIAINTAEQMGSGEQPVRSTVVGVSVARNLGFTMIGGATLIVTAPAVLGWAAAVIVGEGLKKSKAGQAASGAITHLTDQLIDPVKVGEFIKANGARLRAIAADQREFKWMHEWLDWIDVRGQGPVSPLKPEWGHQNFTDLLEYWADNNGGIDETELLEDSSTLQENTLPPINFVRSGDGDQYHVYSAAPWDRPVSELDFSDLVAEIDEKYDNSIDHFFVIFPDMKSLKEYTKIFPIETSQAGKKRNVHFGIVVVQYNNSYPIKTFLEIQISRTQHL